MRTLQILRRTRPRSCGRVSSSAYLEWIKYHNQLWRFPEHQVKAEDCVDNSRPIEVIKREIVKESLERGPSKGDLVMQCGEFVGVVGWVSKREGVVGVLIKGRAPQTYELDWFTDYESPRGRKRWLLA